MNREDTVDITSLKDLDECIFSILSGEHAVKNGGVAAFLKPHLYCILGIGPQAGRGSWQCVVQVNKHIATDLYGEG